jgi:putative phage-type endonuclease
MSRITQQAKNLLENKVDVFVSKYETNAKQRSSEWYALTKSTIGGSELAIVLGQSKYKTIYTLAKEKAGLLPGFTGSMATMWGTVFEDIVARIIELDCGTKIKGAELTIREIPGLRYSPDGYAVVKVHKCPDQKTINLVTRDSPCATSTACPYCEYIIVLIEIKCPHKRKPVEGEIPEHYKPQLLSGLLFSPMTSLALFTEAVIRRCALKNILEKESVAWGMIGVYAQESLDYEEERGIVQTSIGDLYDLGKCNLKYLEEHFKKICDGEYLIEYTDPLFEDESEGLKLGPLLQNLKNRTPVGRHLIAVLPWTLNEIYYSFMERDPNFLKKIMEPVQKFTDLLQNLTQDPDYVEKFIDRELRENQDDFSNLFAR